jgi:hypothetical protein
LVLSDLNGEAQLYGAICLALQTAEVQGFRHRLAGVGNKRQAELVEI